MRPGGVSMYSLLTSADDSGSTVGGDIQMRDG